MKFLIFVVGLIIFAESLSIAFEMPTNKETLLAIGSTNELTDSFQRALSIDDFERKLQSNKIYYSTKYFLKPYEYSIRHF